MRHQPAGGGLRHLVEVHIRGHTFGEKGVGHQQESRLVESAIQLLVATLRECGGRRPNCHLRTAGRISRPASTPMLPRDLYRGNVVTSQKP